MRRRSRFGRTGLPDYRSECFDCGWTDDDAKSTDSARRHALKTGHTAACTVERDFIYRGAEVLP